MCLAAPTLVDCGLTVQLVPCVGQRWQRYGQRRLVRELVSIKLDAERVLLLIERNAELPETLSSQTNDDGGSSSPFTATCTTSTSDTDVEDHAPDTATGIVTVSPPEGSPYSA